MIRFWTFIALLFCATQIDAIQSIPLYQYENIQNASQSIAPNALLTKAESVYEGELYHITEIETTHNKVLARISSRNNLLNLIELDIDGASGQFSAAKPVEFTGFSTTGNNIAGFGYIGDTHLFILTFQYAEYEPEYNLHVLQRTESSTFNLVQEYSLDSLGLENADISSDKFHHFGNSEYFFFADRDTIKMFELERSSGEITSIPLDLNGYELPSWNTQVSYHPYLDQYYISGETSNSRPNFLILSLDPDLAEARVTNGAAFGDSYYNNVQLQVDPASSNIVVNSPAGYQIVTIADGNITIQHTFSANEFDTANIYDVFINGNSLVASVYDWNDNSNVKVYSYSGGTLQQTDTANLSSSEYVDSLKSMQQLPNGTLVGVDDDYGIVSFRTNQANELEATNILSDGYLTNERINGYRLMVNELNGMYYQYDDTYLSIIDASKSRPDQIRTFNWQQILSLSDSPYAVELHMTSTQRIVVTFVVNSQRFIAELIHTEDDVLEKLSVATFLDNNAQIIYSEQMKVSDDFSFALLRHYENLYLFALSEQLEPQLVKQWSLLDESFSEYFTESDQVSLVGDSLYVYGSYSRALASYQIDDEYNLVRTNLFENFSNSYSSPVIEKRGNRVFAFLSDMVATFESDSDGTLTLLSYSPKSYTYSNSLYVRFLAPNSALIKNNDHFNFYQIDDETGVWRRTHVTSNEQLGISGESFLASNQLDSEGNLFITSGSYYYAKGVHKLAVHRAPVPLSTEISLTANVNQTMTVNVASLFEELDTEDTVVYTIENLPNGASFDGQYLTLEPTTADNLAFNVVATDSYDLSSQVTIDYIVNMAPETTAALPQLSYQQDEAFAFDLSQYFADEQTFTFSASGLPSGVTLTSTGSLYGKASNAGSYAITITVTDSLGAAESFELSLTVNETKTSSGSGSGAPWLLCLLALAFIRRARLSR